MLLTYDHSTSFLVNMNRGMLAYRKHLVEIHRGTIPLGVSSSPDQICLGQAEWAAVEAWRVEISAPVKTSSEKEALRQKIIDAAGTPDIIGLDLVKSPDQSRFEFLSY